MQTISDLLFGSNIDCELAFVPHYGMPSCNSIAIGCSWNKDLSVLLTAPGRDIFLIKPNTIITTDKWLTPHGLGVSACINSIEYKDGLYINDNKIIEVNDIFRIKDRAIRCRNTDDNIFSNHLNCFLSKCDAKTVDVIHPIATLSAEGFKIFN